MQRQEGVAREHELKLSEHKWTSERDAWKLKYEMLVQNQSVVDDRTGGGYAVS